MSLIMHCPGLLHMWYRLWPHVRNLPTARHSNLISVCGRLQQRYRIAITPIDLQRCEQCGLEIWAAEYPCFQGSARGERAHERKICGDGLVLEHHQPERTTPRWYAESVCSTSTNSVHHYILRKPLQEAHGRLHLPLP